MLSLSRISLLASVWYVLSVVGLQESKGLYHFWVIVLSTVALILVSYHLTRPTILNANVSKRVARFYPWGIYGLLFYLFILQFGKSHLLYPSHPAFNEWVIRFRTLASALGIVIFLPPVFNRLGKLLGEKRFTRLAFTTFFALGAATLFMGIAASSAPAIDVYVFAKEGAEGLLEGKNPYQLDYTNIYDTATGYYPDGKARYQPYPPLSVLFSTLGHLLGDNRIILAFAHCLAVLFGFLILKGSKALALEKVALPISFLFFPRAVFGIEQSWTDPLLVATWSGFAYLESRNARESRRAFVGGIALALKQTMAPFLCQLWIWNKIPSVRSLIFWALPALFTVTPFLIWDAGALWEDLAFFHLKTPFRPDGLTLSSITFRWWGSPLPAVFAGVGIVLAFGFSYFVKKHWSPFGEETKRPLFWLTFATGYLTILLFSKHAFFNYYYFHLFLVWMGMLTAREQDDLSAA